ncbi:hypothetical protein, partial [Deinococcus ruber]|uniref:hypothetical protein n=1 Tax=Deinococcus ruber TaxID=1848197 RepID=UPI00166A441E
VLALAATIASQFHSEQLTGFEQTEQLATRKRRASTVRLTAQPGLLMVRSRTTAGEISIPVTLSNDTLLPPDAFDLWVDTGMLVQYCRRAKDSVGLSVTAEGLQLRTDQNQLTLSLSPTQEELPWEALPVRATFRASALLDSLLHVRHLRATGENRAILSAWRGILLDGNGHVLRSVAGNGGFAVALHSFAYAGEALRVLLPPGELNGLQALLAAEQSEDVTLATDDAGSRLELRGARGYLRMNLMDHLAYPKYQAVIPKGNSLVVQIESDVIRQALRQLLPLADLHQRAVTMSIGRGEITLSVQSEFGVGRIPLEAETEGGDYVVRFHLPQLLQACSVRGLLKLTMSPKQTPALLIRGPYVVVVAVMRQPQAAA